MKLKQKQKQNRKLHQTKDSKYEEAKNRRMLIEERKRDIQNERRQVAQSLRIRRRQNDQKKYEHLNEIRMKNCGNNSFLIYFVLEFSLIWVCIHPINSEKGTDQNTREASIYSVGEYEEETRNE